MICFEPRKTTISFTLLIRQRCQWCCCEKGIATFAQKSFEISEISEVSLYTVPFPELSSALFTFNYFFKNFFFVLEEVISMAVVQEKGNILQVEYTLLF